MMKILFWFVGALCAAVLSVSAHASPAGLWYAPANDGAGLWVTEDMGAGHFVQWHLYRRDGSSAFVVSGEGCDKLPCIIPLHEPTAPFMGGTVDLGEPVGTLELRQTDTGLRAVYDLRAFDPDNCTGITPGGLLLNRCVGTIDLILLAR